MMAKTFWPHDETCCGRDVRVGMRFSRDVIDYATGQISEWKCTVTEVDPVDFTKVFCRRATVRGDDGRSCRPQVPALFSGQYRAIDNVVEFRLAAQAI